MTARALFREDRPGIAMGLQRRSARDARFEALDKSNISELSTTAINNSTRDELVQTIRVTGLPDRLCAQLRKALPFYDHTTLIRLTYPAQRCCCTHTQGSLGKDAE